MEREMDMIANRPLRSSWPVGQSEMASRTRTHDWSKTPVGPPEGWPQSLKTAVNICLGSRHPIAVWWDRGRLTQFYNDAFISFLGAKKDSSALGQSAHDCWSEIWPIMAPMLESVFTSGEATWSEDFLYVLDRNLPREEGYFTFSYSPIPDDTGAIGGIFCACSETTQRVIGERRLRTLRDLSRMEVQATAERACELAAQTLAENPLDICFSLIYLLEDLARLVATTGLAPAGRAAPATICLQEGSGTCWPLNQVLETGVAAFLSGLEQTFGSLPAGPWPESAQTALVVPIPASGHGPPAGMLVCGLSPRRVFDSDYQSFVNLVAGHIGTSVANARAYAEERKRAEALTEIDRAKTLFFSNVSHEFRTPLSLMLGPLEEALSAPELPQPERDRLDIAHRNSLRLLKLVNSLLDFSRIEAGRAEASYRPTDLAALTIDLASNFRSACEKAGLELVVNCASFSEPVYVDRDMWEKIVLNLLSNAFKFTLEGEIAVRLSCVDGQAELTVRDTGVGIPERELPRLFERFHRIEGQESRTHEGSGIGLALVQELVKLHGGTIGADSKEGCGTTFAIRIPLGTAHLPQDRIGVELNSQSTSIRADAYVQEALRWLPDASFEAPDVDSREELSLSRSARILIADDNADMRAYVRGLLGMPDVETVADGEAALDAIRRRRPDLVLADVMMPRLDGLGLLKAIRADESLRDMPVILLSARADEESRIDGLAAGADDYLVKPFSGRELLARISAHLSLLRIRREAAQAVRQSEERYRTLFETMGQGYCDLELLRDENGRAVDQRYLELNPAFERLFGISVAKATGRKASEVFPALESWWNDSFDRIAKRGEPERIEHEVASLGRWYDVMVYPRGRDRLTVLYEDITERKQIDEVLRQSQERRVFLLKLSDALRPLADPVEMQKAAMRLLAEQLDVMRASFFELDADQDAFTLTARHERNPVPMPDRMRLSDFSPDMAKAYRTGRTLVCRDTEIDAKLQSQRVSYRTIGVRAWAAVPLVRNGRLLTIVGVQSTTPRDWTGAEVRLLEDVAERTSAEVERARAEAALRESERTLRLLLAELQHRVRNILATVRAVADRTGRNSGSLTEFRDHLDGRLSALARTQSVLTRSPGTGVDLESLIREELVAQAAPHKQLSLAGPSIRLSPKAAEVVTLAVHELATNSTKYGALTQQRGYIRIEWSQLEREGKSWLSLGWTESGVHVPKAKPARTGFGTELITRRVPHELHGRGSIRFEPGGVRAEISFPLRDGSSALETGFPSQAEGQRP